MARRRRSSSSSARRSTSRGPFSSLGTGKRRSKRRSKKKGGSFTRSVGRLIRTGLFLGTFAAVAGTAYYGWKATQFDLSLVKEIPERTLVYDHNGILMGHVAGHGENRVSVPASQVSEHFIKALLAREDNRFYDHHGVDPIGVLRALVTNVKSGGKAQGASTIRDTIFLFTGSGPYPGGITLQNEQRLIGQGVALVVEGVTLVGAGAAPTITNGAGAGITLGQDNTLMGLMVGNTTTTDIVGSNFGTLTVTDVQLSGNGGALDLDNGTLAAAFGPIEVNTGVRGIDLDTVTGSLSIAGTDIVVITLAEEGVVYATADASGHVPAMATNFIDSTGASDALTAAVVFGLLNDIPIDEAVRLGASAAALTLSCSDTVCVDLSLELLYEHLVI